MSEIKTHRVGIIMNGVTGRMGTNQHLLRSIKAIIDQGGVALGPTEFIMPDPILIGRNQVKLNKLSELTGIEKTSTNLDEVLKDPDYSVYFDAQTTERRSEAVKKAIAVGKHIYCEKPTALTSEEGVELFNLATEAGLKNGVVQDKLWLPGLLKLKMLIDTGWFGEIHAIRGEFGYWVFEGDTIPSQRPSWNSRKEDGGGMILDMFAHWHYVLNDLFGKIKGVSCLGATHVKKRWDEEGKAFDCTADDSAYATFELKNGIIAQFNCSWSTRVRRDDLLTLHVDGSKGSAVVGLRKCLIQPAAATPKPIWNPDIDNPIDFYNNWTPVPDNVEYNNAFKAQWELFLKHVVADTPFPWNLLEGAKGVQLAEKAMESWEKRAWMDLPE